MCGRGRAACCHNQVAHLGLLSSVVAGLVLRLEKHEQVVDVPVLSDVCVCACRWSVCEECSVMFLHTSHTCKRTHTGGHLREERAPRHGAEPPAQRVQLPQRVHPQPDDTGAPCSVPQNNGVYGWVWYMRYEPLGCTSVRNMCNKCNFPSVCIHSWMSTCMHRRGAVSRHCRPLPPRRRRSA